MKIEINNFVFVVNILISIGIPLAVFFFLLIKRRKYMSSFLTGAIVFLVSQIFIRLPILSQLEKTSWYTSFNMFYPVVFILFLSLSAGLFEEGGRFLGFKCLKRKRSWKDAVAFGFGHGGIEAMIIVGASQVANLSAVNDINNGTFNPLKYGVSEEVIINVFSKLSNIDVLLVGVERISAMAVHIFLSVVVLYGFVKAKRLKYLILAILGHTAFNFIAVMTAQLGFGSIVVEIVLFVLASLGVIMTFKLKKLFELETNELV